MYPILIVIDVGFCRLRDLIVDHGRFVEMVLNHFDKLFSASYVSALAMPTLGDVVAGNS